MIEYDRIRVLACDHLNLARGKYLTPEVSKTGTTHLSIGTYALGYDRVMVPAPGAMMLEGLPDMEATFDLQCVRPGWEKDTGVVVANFHRNGSPLPLCARSRLQKSISTWHDRGLKPQVGIELEGFVFQRNENGSWVPYDTPGAFVYGTGKSVDPAGLVDLIWKKAIDCELPIQLINTEYDWPQFEFTLSHTNALKAADDAFLLRAMAKELLLENGFLLSFMPKPLSDRGGSGFHINLSFSDKANNNAMEDKKNTDGLSKLAKQSIAGLLRHHEGLTALVAPTVNSYRRIRPGNLAGYWANWGHDHRGVTVRIPEQRGKFTRLEWRLPDCASNPYLAIVCILEAAHLGVIKEYSLPPEETGDCIENADSTCVAPETLGSALEALVQDNELTDAVGKSMVEHFCAIKTKEWSDFLNHTSDWETTAYINFI